MAGVAYFGGGAVERVPFFWYHFCFTVSYTAGKKANRFLSRNLVFI